jgi:hypothetical protein
MARVCTGVGSVWASAGAEAVWAGAASLGLTESHAERAGIRRRAAVRQRVRRREERFMDMDW